MEEKTVSYKLGSEELNKKLESKYYKFTKGSPQNIEVEANQEVVERTVEFEDKEGKKVVTKYDLEIMVDEQPKIWSVSNKVLTTINEHIHNTTKFKIILRDTCYDVIPLGLKE